MANPKTFTLTDTTAVAIDNVSTGNEFLVCVQGTIDTSVLVQYDDGEGAYKTFASGTLTAAGETVFVAPGTALQVVSSGASPDANVIVTEMKFEG